MTTFGKRVRDLRIRNGVSINYLSKSTGIHRTTIQRWERKNTVPTSHETIALISNFFHVPPEYFFRDEPTSSPDILSEIRQLREEVNSLREQMSRLSDPSRNSS